MRKLINFLILVIALPIVIATYNSDGVTVAINEWTDFQLTYTNDSGAIVDTANCYWTVLDPTGTIVVNNASWTANPAVLSIPAYYNYSFKPTMLGLYRAIVTCNLSSDNPPNQVLDASFVVALDTQDYLEGKIIQYQSHGGGGIGSGNYTISVSETGFWKAKETIYFVVLLVVITLLYLGDWVIEKRKEMKEGKI